MRLHVQDDVAVKVPHALAEKQKNDQDDQDDEDEEKRVLYQSLTFVVYSCEQGSPPFASLYGVMYKGMAVFVWLVLSG
jgi:hypothetical protein